MKSAFKIETELVEADFYYFITFEKSVVDFDSFVDYFDNDTSTSRVDNKTFREHFSSVKDKINEYFEQMRSNEVVFAEYADETLNVCPDYNRDSSKDYQVDVEVFTEQESDEMISEYLKATNDKQREQLVELETIKLIERVEFFKQFSRVVYIPVVDSIFFYCIK